MDSLPTFPEKGTQNWDLLQAFLRGEALTVLTAVNRYGVMALSQRVGEIRKLGWPVRRDDWLELPIGKRVKRYSL